MAELIVLRLIHVMGGIFWVGAMMYNTFFLMPAMNAAGPQASGAVSKGLMARHLFTVMPAVAILTMLSGFRLMQITSAGFAATWFQSRSGSTFAMGGLAAIIAFVGGLLLSRPTMMKLGATLAERAAAPADKHAALDARIAGLRSRAAIVNGTVSFLLLAAAAAMAVARYL
jgi:uncharacterized membrane protein